MWFEAIVIGVFIGVIRGGRLSNLGENPLKGIMLIIIGLLIQLVPFFLNSLDFIKQNTHYFTIAGLLIASIAIIWNIRKAGMVLVLIGTILNALVLFFHNYKMPIRLADATTARFAQMKLSIASGQIPNYMLFSESTHWSRFFGKLFLTPDYYIVTQFFGIPDLLIALGVIWLIQSEMQMTRSYGSSYYPTRRRY